MKNVKKANTKQSNVSAVCTLVWQYVLFLS